MAEKRRWIEFSKAARVVTESPSWQDQRDQDVAARRWEALKPRTDNHRAYFACLASKVVTLCTGPAGTGKTWQACGHAARMLVDQRVDRIVLTRPLVPCGRGYGFRPGTTLEKILPDMRPMIEALEDFLGKKDVARLMEEGKIELLPLDDMRGSNIRRTFILCDEAQNALDNQLHMLLTRFAKGSKVVLAGDATKSQIDLHQNGENPFKKTLRLIQQRGGHKDIGVVAMTRADIMRHPLIQWLDETLSEEVIPNALQWFDEDCPACDKKIFFEDTEEGDVDQIECCHCQAVIELYDGDAMDPYLADKRSADCVGTLPRAL